MHTAEATACTTLTSWRLPLLLLLLLQGTDHNLLSYEKCVDLC
jgi:hypothetical protein